MATQKTARVHESVEVAADARLVTLVPSERLDFVGGQYLIVNSGVTLPDGKLAKRAYSIVSPDAQQERVTLLVKRIGDGPGSSFMHRLRAGDEVPFSGPWGKFLADDARPRRATWVIASDTAITAALGLLAGRAFLPQVARAELVWLVESERYFAPDELVRPRLPHGLRWRRVPLPAVAHPERVAAALGELERMLAGGAPESAFLAGDGDVVYPLRERLVRAGVDDGNIRVECFFNNPAKKSV
jgi:ferredoxin-NADP reductase